MAEKETILARLKNTQDRLITAVGQRLKSLHQYIDHLAKSLQDPRKRLADTWMRLDEIHVRLARLMGLIIRDRRLKMNTERRALLIRSPVNVMVAMKQRLDFQRNALGRAINGHIGDRHTTYSLLEKRIRDLSPLSILNRGYSITRRLPEKMVLTDVSGVNRGDRVQVILAEGELECRVEEVEPDKKI